MESSADREYLYDIRNIRVVDGDTIECDILLQADLGFREFITLERRKHKLRMYGINAPETRGSSRPEGLRSKKWLNELMLVSRNVRIQTIKDKSGKYGRYLAIVLVKQGTEWVNVNEKMVELGLAVEYMK